ncbi:MAG: DNA polymerase III subunit alpha [Steroidobacteraceae bacterium]
MPPTFVHLRLHTEYSLVDSVVRIKELMKATAGAGMPALALTDQGNLFAMVKFYRGALGAGLQPIIGVDLELREADAKQAPTRLTLLAQNLAGYRNLTRLVSRAYLEGQSRGTPQVERDWLSPAATSGLIALSCAQEGDIGRWLLNGKPAQAEAALDFWLQRFADRFYVEVQRVGHAQEEAYLNAVLPLAARRGVPIVATNDVRFLAPEDFESHEARVCIHDGQQLADPARPRRYTPQQYLRTPQEMAELFADLPEALANSVAIAQRCNLLIKFGEARLPEYPVPEGSTPNDFLRAEAARGLAARLVELAIGAEQQPAYHQRLEVELKVICQMGFSGYFLIVADFIRWAKHNGVPVGPGRGSGAGSLVAYALGITDLDPLRYDLLFERFLNPERVSMPDFDVDFCMVGRDRVIEYVAQKYGRERVSQIITYGTMAAKAVVRDVGRVLGHPYGMVDRIAKLVPFELEMTLEKALEKEPELKRLYDNDEEVHDLIDRARALEDLTRNAGKHAGGVVIAPSVLTDFTPLYCEAGGSNVVTQFDKDDVEASGLVKFDFLGLRTLTIIDWAMRTINARRQAAGAGPLDLARLPMNDAPSYELLKSGRTTAIFQLESRGMKDLIRRLKPDTFEDIVALVALFRPGPLQSGMVDDFIARKHDVSGQAIDYLHPDLKPVLFPTYGVILYQEQVMQIAQVLAGYTLGGADMLRRAMGKKKPEEMAKERGKFLKGSTERGVPEVQAGMIFDLMEKFAGYGFNKSHSAAYALLTYQTAYLKRHYPAAFMAAVLSADMDRTDKVVALIEDCKDFELTVLPPDVNSSGFAFAVADEKTIRYGLGAVKGVGEGAVEAIVTERVANGPYTNLVDLCRRVDLTRVNRRVFEALIRSGSLDALGHTRASMMEGLSAALAAGEQQARSHQTGQNDFFGLSANVSAAPTVQLRELPEWVASQRLAGERETLGLYLTGHPIGRYEADLKRFVSGRIGEFMAEPAPAEGVQQWGSNARVATLAGQVWEIRKRGNRNSFVLDDRTGRIEVALYEEVFNRCRELIARDAMLLVEGALRFDSFSDAWRLHAKQVQSLDAVRERQARSLVLSWPGSVARAAELIAQLKGLLQPLVGGQCQVVLRYENDAASGALVFGPEWRIRPDRAVLEALEQLLGPQSLRLTYTVATGNDSAQNG